MVGKAKSSGHYFSEEFILTPVTCQSIHGDLYPLVMSNIAIENGHL